MPFGCISRSLSLRMVEENAGGARHCRDLLNRAPVGNEIRQGVLLLDPPARSARGDKWHLNEIAISTRPNNIGSGALSTRMASFLEVLIQRRRDSRAAQRLVKKLLKFAGTPPRVMITYKPRSYGATRAKMGFHNDHRHHKARNHRAENSHPPTRRRERIIKRFKSSRQAQRLVSVHDQVANLFHVRYSGAVIADFRRASRKPAFAISCAIRDKLSPILKPLRGAFFGSVPD